MFPYERRWWIRPLLMQNLGASPQLECWNNGTMEQWVLGKWGNGILTILLLTRRYKVSKKV
jgi:hypothetical protein